MKIILRKNMNWFFEVYMYVDYIESMVDMRSTRVTIPFLEET